MSNRKRTRGRQIQAVKYYRYETKNGNQVRIEIDGPSKQIKHPVIGAAPNDPWGMSKAKEFEEAMADDMNQNRYRS